MAIVQGIVAGIGRSLGRVFNMAFGWANVLLFGRVPQDRQIYLSAIAFGSLIWIIVVIGIAFPAFGAWMLTFASLPKWVDLDWVRIAMLSAAVVIPMLIGFLS